MPRAGDAFLNGALPLVNNPTTRITSQPPTTTLDIGAIFQEVVTFVETYIFPAIDHLTGIDLSSPAAFFTSVATLLANGGTAALSFIQAIVQSVVDFIMNGLTGGTGTGNPIYLLTSALQNVVQQLSTVTQAATGAFSLASSLAGIIQQFVDGLGALPIYTDAVGLLEAVQPVVQSFVETAFGAFTGLIGGFDNFFLALTGQATRQDTGTSSAATATQLQHLVATTAANSAAVQALQSTITGAGNSGLSSGDTFEYTTTTSALPGWLQRISVAAGGSATGYLATPNGHDLTYTDTSGGSPNATICQLQKTGPDAATDTVYQAISITIGSPVIDWPGFFSTASARNDIYGRMNTAGTEYVRAECTEQSVQLYYAIAGVEHTFPGFTTPVNLGSAQGVGMSFKLLCGGDAGENQYQLLRNGSPVITLTDNTGVAGAPLSQIDDLHKGWGVGCLANANGGITVRPGAVTGCTVSDNTPAATVGTGVRLYRAAGSAVTLTTGAALPSALFDTFGRVSNDINWASGVFTCTKAGWYGVDIRLQGGGTWPTTPVTLLTLRVNGTEVVWGDEFASGGAAGTQLHTAVKDSMRVYLDEGDTLTPGLSSASPTGMGIVGDAGGLGTYLAIVLESGQQ